MATVVNSPRTSPTVALDPSEIFSNGSGFQLFRTTDPGGKKYIHLGQYYFLVTFVNGMGKHIEITENIFNFGKFEKIGYSYTSLPFAQAASS